MSYSIQQPVVADAEELVAMHGQSWLDTYPAEEHGVSLEYVQKSIEERATPESLEKRRDYIRESHTNQDYYLRIARNSEGRLVGFIDGRKGEVNELTGLYIDKSEYGKGLAQELCKGLLEWLGDEKDIQLTVVDYNDRAQKFYNKMGFEKIEGSEYIYKDVMPVIKMVRKRRKT